jgi:hypothetical protein
VPLEVRVSSFEGRVGNWVAPASMNRIYFLLTECLPRYRAAVAHQDEIISLQAEMIDTSSSALALARDVADEAIEAAEAASEAAARARRVDDGVFTTPLFWFIAGTVFGVAALASGAVLVGGRGG